MSRMLSKDSITAPPASLLSNSRGRKTIWMGKEKDIKDSGGNLHRSIGHTSAFSGFWGLWFEEPLCTQKKSRAG